MTFVLRIALIISLLVHLVLLSLLTSRGAMTEVVAAGKGEVLSTSLRVSVTAMARSESSFPSISHGSAETQINADSVGVQAAPGRRKVLARSTAKFGKKSLQGRGAASILLPDDSQQAVADMDGESAVRYRLVLARQLRRYQQNSLWMHDISSKSEVLLSISSGAQFGVPELRLVRSSGQEMFDQRVMVLVGLVLSDSPLPEYLKGRTFRINLLVGAVGE